MWANEKYTIFPHSYRYMAMSHRHENISADFMVIKQADIK